MSTFLSRPISLHRTTQHIMNLGMRHQLIATELNR